MRIFDCYSIFRSNTESLCKLPEQWLEGLMNDVTSDQPMLCATRRSAGIPFAIQVSAKFDSELTVCESADTKDICISILIYLI